MKNKFKLSSMLLFLVVLTLALTSCGKKEDKEEKQEESKVEKISEDAAEFATVWDGDAEYVDFNQHDVEYDTNLGGNEITLAQDGVLIFKDSVYKRFSRDELENYFTSWGCKVIEQGWAPTISETGEVIEEFQESDPMYYEVVKTFLKDDHIEVILYGGLYYDLYNVYFVDGKIDNIEFVRSYDEEQYVETYGDIYD